MNKKKILSLILVCCMLAGMIPAALANTPSPTATKTCTIAQDTGPTGPTPSVTDNVITFSGKIPYIEARQDNFPPISGNYVGVRIVSEENQVPANGAKVTITEVDGTALKTDYNVDLEREPQIISESSSKAGIQFWPLIKNEEMLKKEIKFSVDWDGEGTAYEAQTFTIKFAQGTTLEKPTTEFAIAQDPGPTGGADCQVAVKGTTITFTGSVDFYPAEADGFPPKDGHMVGVQINVKDDNSYKTPFWFQIPGHSKYDSVWTKADEGGASKLWYYPTLSKTASENQFEILVSASEAGSFPTKFTIDATGVTLKASPADVALSDKKNLSGIGMEPVTGSVAQGYTVKITGTDVTPGLEEFNTDALKDVYNDFNPTNNSTWNSVPETAQKSNFTIISLDLPVTTDAKSVQITQTSKALKQFYCDGKTSGKSDLDERITVDSGKETATKTHTYTPTNGKIWMDFIAMEGDTVTFKVTENGSTITYNVDTTGLTFATSKPPVVEVKDPGFAISTSNSILGKKASDLMLNAALTQDESDATKFTVTGTAKHVENWTAFDATLHTGHYLALTVTKPDNLPDGADYTVTAQGDQKITFDKDHFFTEGTPKDTETFVMYLDKLTDSKFTLAFDWDGAGSAEAVTYTFDVSGMSMPVKDAVVVAKPTVGADQKASASVDKSAIDTAISALTPSGGGATPDPVVVIDATKNDDGEITSAKSAAVTLPKEAVGALKTASDSKTDLTVNVATPVGTVEVNNKVLEVLASAATTENIILNVETKSGADKPTGAASDEAYEVNFATSSGDEVEVTGTDVKIVLTLRFSNITNPDQVKIANDKTTDFIIPTASTWISSGTYDFTFTTTHLTTFYATKSTTPTPAIGTVTKAEDSDSNLGKTIKFSVANAGSSITNAYLTVNAKRGSGTDAVNFCTVVPVTLTSGAGSNVAELYFQNDVTITGAWVTSVKPTLTDGQPASGSILASMPQQP